MNINLKIGKRLIALSDSSKMIKNYNSLIKCLEDLICDKIYNLSLIDSSIVNDIDLLIDICLKYNVYPSIDYSKQEILFRGDYQSSSQCFFNINQDKKIYQYFYLLNNNEINLINPFISLKIDEAIINQQTNVCFLFF